MERVVERGSDAGAARAAPHVGVFVCASVLLHGALVAAWLPDASTRTPRPRRSLHTLQATLAVGTRGELASAEAPLAPRSRSTNAAADAPLLPSSVPSAPTPASSAPGGTRDSPGAAGAPVATPTLAPELAAWLAQQRAARGAAAQAGLEAALQDLPAGVAGEVHCTLSPQRGPHCEGLERPGLAEPMARILVAAGTAWREGLLPSPAVLMAHGTTIRMTWTVD